MLALEEESTCDRMEAAETDLHRVSMARESLWTEWPQAFDSYDRIFAIGTRRPCAALSALRTTAQYYTQGRKVTPETPPCMYRCAAEVSSQHESPTDTFSNKMFESELLLDKAPK